MKKKERFLGNGVWVMIWRAFRSLNHIPLQWISTSEYLSLGRDAWANKARIQENSQMAFHRFLTALKYKQTKSDNMSANCKIIIIINKLIKK